MDVLWGSFGLFGLGALTMLLPRKYEEIVRILGLLSASLASLALLVFAVGVLDEGRTHTLLLGSYSFAVDGWSAAFLAILGIAGTLVSLYALDYTKSYAGHGLRALTGLWNLFLLSMGFVVVANDAFTFILAWEVMALVSFLLVNHEGEKKETVHAAYQYMVMTHLGTAAILVAFYLLGSGADSFSFADLATSTLSPDLRSLAFLAAFTGFALKAGLMPLHVWLPNAHPAAPSHVSAMMSGVMLKIALYGFGRFVFSFFGMESFAFALLVSITALISAFLGALYATMETDMKKVLAYSSVENMGIIFAAFGCGMLLTSLGKDAYAVVAFTAALVHAFSHSMMKALLFMSAGAVLHATKTRHIEQLGALASRMPYTAAFTLVGAMALSSLPFTSGLLGEWLTLQSFVTLLWQGGGTEVEGIRILVLFALILLGLTGALALGCFVRLYSVVFLGRRRSSAVLGVKETSFWMLFGMGAEALCILIVGLFPAPLIKTLSAILAKDTESVHLTCDTALYWNGAKDAVAGATFSQYSPLYLLVFALLIALVLAISLSSKKLYVKSYSTWNCGTDPTRREQYTATGFSKPLRRAFSMILRPRRERRVENKTHAYFGRELYYKLEIPDTFREKLYHPLEEGIVHAANVLRRIQQGSVRLYIGYTMTAMLLVLLWGVLR